MTHTTQAGLRASSPYGQWCPTCGTPIVSVTRGIPSIGICANGHKMDRRDTLQREPTRPAPQETAPAVGPVAGAPERMWIADISPSGSDWSKAFRDKPEFWSVHYHEYIRADLASPPPSAAPTDNTALDEGFREGMKEAAQIVYQRGQVSIHANREEAVLHSNAILAALASRPAAPKADTDVAAQLEAMARAMCEKDGANWDASDCNHTANGEEPEEQREYWRDKAEAALAALTDPANNRSAGGDTK